MTTITKTTIALGLSLFIIGCPGGDDATTGQDTDATTNGMTGMTTMTTMTTDPMTSADTTEGMTADTTEGPPGTDSGTVTDTDESTSTGLDPGPFVGDDPDPDAYTRVDRKGMPAVNTALILMANKDTYNNATPQIDAADTFIPDISASIAGLHMALDDDLMTAGLVPCPTTQACRLQVEPLIVPDTLSLDLSMETSFPNGRRLDDQAVDITLAVLLLDLVPPPPMDQQNVMTFANIPLNPAANDVMFSDEFPFLAPAHP